MAKASKKGRAGGLNEARELIALLATLDDEGDSIDAAAIAERLDCDEAHAQKLLYLLSSTNTENYIVPLYADDSEKNLVLANATTGSRGYGLRLSAAETTALLAALEKLGVPKDDPLRARLDSSLLSAEAKIDRADVRRVLGGEKATSIPEHVQTCSAAIAGKKALRFLYTKVRERGTSERLVVPQSLEFKEGFWYVNTYDLVRSDTRQFKVDRMEQLAIEDVPQTAPRDLPAGEKGRARTLVQLAYTDVRYLENYLWWPDLEFLTQNEDGSGTAQIPYLENSTWLPRQVAACGGTVTTNNAQVNQLAREYAQAQLSS